MLPVLTSILLLRLTILLPLLLWTSPTTAAGEEDCDDDDNGRREPKPNADGVAPMDFAEAGVEGDGDFASEAAVLVCMVNGRRGLLLLF